MNTKRPLKNLMIKGEKGCDQNSPGIGDIEYVKDIRTEKIVTSSFRCSKFGIAHVGANIGWVGIYTVIIFQNIHALALYSVHEINNYHKGLFLDQNIEDDSSRRRLHQR